MTLSPAHRQPGLSSGRKRPPPMGTPSGTSGRAAGLVGDLRITDRAGRSLLHPGSTDLHGTRSYLPAHCARREPSVPSEDGAQEQRLVSDSPCDPRPQLVESSVGTRRHAPPCHGGPSDHRVRRCTAPITPSPHAGPARRHQPRLLSTLGVNRSGWLHFSIARWRTGRRAVSSGGVVS